MRLTYDIDARFTGDGSLDEYGFTSKIEALDHLLILILDGDGLEVARFRGDGTDDTLSYLDTVVFDAVNGGGTVTLNDVLPTDYEIVMLLANDEPAQTDNYRTQGLFNLKNLEMTFDKIVGALQRAAWLAQRSIRLHDSREAAFDVQLPQTLTPGAAICISDDGLGLAMGQTADLNAFVASGPFECPEDDYTVLSGETHDPTVYNMVQYQVRVKRGVNVFALCRFTMFYQDGSWDKADDPDIYIGGWNASGVTFEIDDIATGAIAADVDNSGDGDAILYIKKLRWSV